MKVLRNKYHKKLHFEVNNHSIGIDAYDILSVEDEDAKILLKNPWIELDNPKTIKEKAEVRAKIVARPICKPCVEAQEKSRLIVHERPKLVISKKPKVVKYKGRRK